MSSRPGSTSSALVYVQKARLMISSFGSLESFTNSRAWRKTRSTISSSGFACPGGFTAACRHRTIPPESDCSVFSMKNAAGNKITSVEMVFGSTPGRCQKLAVSAFHSDQLPFSYSRDHSATARAEMYEVMNSPTFASFRFSAVALTLDRSRNPLRASPVPPPRASLSQSQRLTPCLRANVDSRKRLSFPSLVDPFMDCSAGSQIRLK